MISLKELNPHNYPTTPEVADNLNTLLTRLNVIRKAWGKPMVVTSGLRSEADQARINPSAPKSKHLIGCAADIADKDGSLGKWCKANETLLENEGLWCEDPTYTKGWVHFQTKAPASGRRFFVP